MILETFSKDSASKKNTQPDPEEMHRCAFEVDENGKHWGDYYPISEMERINFEWVAKVNLEEYNKRDKEL